MTLHLSVDRGVAGGSVALGFETLNGQVKITLGGVDEQAAITSLLVYAYTRKADLFVSTCMDLTNVAVHNEVSDAMNQLALLVINLDTAGWDIATANKHIQAKNPGMLKLVGRTAWSGYAKRRKEFDELAALAELINERVKHPEPKSCMMCLRPISTTVCTTCTNTTPSDATTRAAATA